jgi:hypothetical protein
LWVVDLFGQGGVWVNDSLVRYIKLEDGDLLKVGRFLIRVHYETPSLESHPATAYSSAALSSVDSAEESGEQDENEAIEDAPSQEPLEETQALPHAHSAKGDLILLPQVSPAIPTDLTQALIPFAEQFGQMQQQMFDQFQQAMLMMFQMFNTLHRDQMLAIREELDRLRELTEEVRTVQTEIAKHSPPGYEQPPAPFDPGAFPNFITAVAIPPYSGNSYAEWIKPVESPLAAEVPAASEPVSDAPIRPEPEAPPSPAPPVTPAEVAPPKAPPFAPTESTRNLHACLAQRLAALQQERQTRWQKILSFMTGK